MRKNIFYIYRALRNFDVTAEEVGKIADGYRHWIDNPIESRPHYNTVYAVDGKLYAMPYPKDSIFGKFVGYELNGVVYLSCYRQYVYGSDVAECVRELAADFGKKKLYCPQIPEIELGLPTAAEVTELVRAMKNQPGIGYKIYHFFGMYWIKPSAEFPNKPIANVLHRINKQVGCDLYIPNQSTQAVVCLVTHLREGIDFLGEVDDFGTPTSETEDAYEVIYNSLSR